MARIQERCRRSRLESSGLIGLLSFLLIVGSLFTMGLYFKAKGYIINVSPSLPLGIYKTFPITEPLEIGDIVQVQIPKDLMQTMLERGYRRKDKGVQVNTLLKVIQGKEGDIFSLEETELGKRVVKNGTTTMGMVFLQDLQGQAFVTPKEWRVEKGEYFLMGEHTRSYDSRYFGPIKAEYIIRKACPVWTWKGEK